MTANLTRDEAIARSRMLEVESYTVEIDLTRGEDRFGSETVMRFRCSEPSKETFADLVAEHVHEVTLNGTPLGSSAYDIERGRLTLAGLTEFNELRVVADCAYSASGEGLHRMVDPMDGEAYLHTQLQTADAQRVFACFDQPDLKATFDLTVLAPEHWQVVSNTSADGFGTGGRWHFPPHEPLPTYLMTIVAGPFYMLRREHDGIPLGLYCRKSLSPHLDAEADELFEVTVQGLDFLQREFCFPYPFKKYDQLFVPGLKVGAMENPACVTYYENFLFRSQVTDAEREARASVMLHEMSHMWFGDLVTMKWWDGLWLNESFATYLGTTAQAAATRWGEDVWATFVDADKGWAYDQDQRPTTHPIAAAIPDVHSADVNFDGITYSKGAAVLKLLGAWVGHDCFLAGVRNYFTRFAWKNTELRDFLGVLEEASGRDLSQWSKEWLETAGVNTLRIEFKTDEDGCFTDIMVLQEGDVLRSHPLAIGLYERQGDRLVRRRRIETDVTGERTSVEALVGAARPDLLLLNDDDLTYAKVRLDAHSVRTLLDGGIGRLPSALPRALCRAALWDLTRDGELPAHEYVRHIITELPTLTDIGVTESLLRQAAFVVHRYVSDERRAGIRAELGTALRDLATQAEPGGDHQLAYVKALAEVVAAGDELAFLRSLLDQEEKLPGLTVGADLRWTLLAALAGCGAADEPEIAAELAADPTESGEQAAAACRAALPTAEAKAAAWAAIAGGALAGTALRTLIAGFTGAATRGGPQRDLLEPYATRYFDEIEGIWAGRSPGVARQFVKGCYPALFASEWVLKLTQERADAADTPDSLRRLLLEGADDVRRTLRVRAATVAV
ncbi:aminopeptidase N [Actinomadura pelletieri DSM 43383]|uniref:Aminopeptidase N n=1 Tax=Actinomadura pelletieri DSM 43383 TaxID=1120940 RepID=A0A495Q9Q8_9ACTN|nr:aminopeptidase N [Actinomadura pelletieri]RKS68230.1 aminopeptidase N [Actinomadura pelletieri DSM 43383]